MGAGRAGSRGRADDTADSPVAAAAGCPTAATKPVESTTVAARDAALARRIQIPGRPDVGTERDSKALYLVLAHLA